MCSSIASAAVLQWYSRLFSLAVVRVGLVVTPADRVLVGCARIGFVDAFSVEIRILDVASDDTSVVDAHRRTFVEYPSPVLAVLPLSTRFVVRSAADVGFFHTRRGRRSTLSGSHAHLPRVARSLRAVAGRPAAVGVPANFLTGDRLEVPDDGRILPVTGRRNAAREVDEAGRRIASHGGDPYRARPPPHRSDCR